MKLMACEGSIEKQIIGNPGAKRDFLAIGAGDGKYFTLPALSSTSTNIVRFRVVTIVARQHDGRDNQENVEIFRQDAVHKMGQCTSKTRPKRNVKRGASMLRSFNVFDEKKLFT